MSLTKIQPLPAQELLDARFNYNKYTGILTWKRISKEYSLSLGWSNKRYTQFNTRFAGVVAGHTFKSTRGGSLIQVRFDSKSYYIHRLIWKLVTGLDCNLIDHIDGNPLNNIWSNLRDVSSGVNAKNCRLSTANSSGHTGVSWSKTNSKWEAYIWKDYKKYNLGLFCKLEDAIAVRKNKEVEFNYHENHGTVR